MCCNDVAVVDCADIPFPLVDLVYQNRPGVLTTTDD